MLGVVVQNLDYNLPSEYLPNPNTGQLEWQGVSVPALDAPGGFNATMAGEGLAWWQQPGFSLQPQQPAPAAWSWGGGAPAGASAPAPAAAGAVVQNTVTGASVVQSAVQLAAANQVGPQFSRSQVEAEMAEAERLAAAAGVRLDCELRANSNPIDSRPLYWSECAGPNGTTQEARLIIRAGGLETIMQASPLPGWVSRSGGGASSASSAAPAASAPASSSTSGGSAAPASAAPVNAVLYPGSSGPAGSFMPGMSGAAAAMAAGQGEAPVPAAPAWLRFLDPMSIWPYLAIAAGGAYMKKRGRQ